MNAAAVRSFAASSFDREAAAVSRGETPFSQSVGNEENKSEILDVLSKRESKAELTDSGRGIVFDISKRKKKKVMEKKQFNQSKKKCFGNTEKRQMEFEVKRRKEKKCMSKDTQNLDWKDRQRDKKWSFQTTSHNKHIHLYSWTE